MLAIAGPKGLPIGIPSIFLYIIVESEFDRHVNLSLMKTVSVIRGRECMMIVGQSIRTDIYYLLRWRRASEKRKKKGMTERKEKKWEERNKGWSEKKGRSKKRREKKKERWRKKVRRKKIMEGEGRMKGRNRERKKRGGRRKKETWTE